MTEKILKIFIETKQKSDENQTYYPNLEKRFRQRHAYYPVKDINDPYNSKYLTHRMTRETVLGRVMCGWSDCLLSVNSEVNSEKAQNDETLRQLEAHFDDIMRVLVENNFIQYDCCSTVGYYFYSGDK